MSPFITRALPELLSFIVDNRGRSCPTVDEGFPLIATNCLRDGLRYPSFENVRYVDEETYGNWFRSHPEPGDVLFVCKGSPGRVAVVPDPVPFCIAQDMVALRADRDVVDSTYLYYRLKTPDVQAAIPNLHVGTMIPHFKKGDFGKLRFEVHANLAEQRGIAEVLGALDDKIAANAKVSATADELSRVTFESLLPDGDTVPLSSLARFVNGRAFTKDASGSGRVVIRIAELNSGLGSSTVYNDIDVADDHVAGPGDLLFAWSGSLTVHRWYRGEGVVNQHIFKVIPTEVPMWVVKGALDRKLAEFRAVAADKATTMGHIQRRHLDEPVVIPVAGQIEAHGEAMHALWSRALSAEQESLRLEQLRDVLLPQLMSGKIRVKDAERVVEGIV